MGCMVQWTQSTRYSAPPRGAEPTAILCFLRKVIGPNKVQVDNKGIFDGLRKGEKECVKPRAGDSDLWFKNFGRNYMFWKKEASWWKWNTIPLKTNSNDFGEFWNYLADSNSNIVVAKIIFFERFEFLVCSKFNHTHHVAVHVHVLWLVCAHIIPFRMLWRP